MHRLLLISFIAFLIGSNSFAGFRCFKPGKMAHIANKKQVVTKINFCIDHNDYSIISFNCIKPNKCDAINAYKNSESLNYHDEIGSPHHHKCYLLGGTPRLISYFTGKSWQETGICEFKDDSFISLFNKLSVD